MNSRLNHGYYHALYVTMLENIRPNHGKNTHHLQPAPHDFTMDFPSFCLGGFGDLP